MKFHYAALLNVTMLVGGASVSSDSLGQVDQFWLRSWNEAQESRPEVMVSASRIAHEGEPGTPLIIHGTVFQPDGRTPAADVVVHSYHRDQAGFDFGLNDTALTTWRLQGWVVTDAEGQFEFQTIMPAADHLGSEGPHLHFTVDSATLGRQWAPTVYFLGDPLVPESRIRQSNNAGEFGQVREVVTVNSVQHVNVNIRLKEEADF